jgi:hypothetical protein
LSETYLVMFEGENLAEGLEVVVDEERRVRPQVRLLTQPSGFRLWGVAFPETGNDFRYKSIV